ncbi:MAG: T9SS type A sorting domain-containing protein [Ferruginibacter sp.]
MKKLLSLTAIFLFVSVISQAQYSIDWVRPAEAFSKTGVMMVRDQADNVAVTGFITSNNIFTRKYDRFGNLQWEAVSTSGVASNYEKPVWINADSNNNILVVGYRYANSGSLQYPNALVVLKYAPSGTLLWKQTIAMTFFVNSFISFNLRSEVDANGNLYIGTVASSPSGFVLVKLAPDGTTLFTSNNNLNGVTMFRSLRLNGNRIVFSGSSSNLSAAIAIAWDTTGNVLWTGSFLGQSGNDVELDNAGNVYMLTSYPNQVTASSGQDILIYKIDPSGTQLWVKNFDFGGQDFPTRFTLVGNKLSVIGYGSISASYFDWITFQLDTGGNILWNVRYNETSGNDEQSNFIAAQPNGEVFVTGRGGPMFIQFGNSYLRMITVKYDNTGVRKWVDSVHIYGGKGIACSIASDSSLYVLSDSYMTAFHFLDHTEGVPAAVPSALNVTNIASTYATFSWTAVPNAYLYHLRYKKSSDIIWTVASINIPNITINGLTAATSYDYACEAINSGGPSGYSATQTFSTGTVLPINGFDINVKRQGTNVLLNWSTQSEQNSAYFEVERSYDGLAFFTIGRVQAAGNSSGQRNYSYLDLNVENRLIYYRLKLTDIDAAFKISPIRIVPKIAGQQEFSFFPNPATTNADLVLNEPAREDIQLRMINQLGQVVLYKLVVKGIQLIKLDLQTLSPGIYAVSLTSPGLVWINKLVVK